MLVPVETAGSRLPLLLVHGLFGVLPWRRGRALAEFLGPDQPVYGLEAPGFDGSRKPRGKVPAATNEYLSEIRRARVKPPFVVLGVCGGCIMAIQLAQSLAVAAQFAGEPPPVPLLILIDPPGLPGHEFKAEELSPEAAEMLRDRVSNWFTGARHRLEEVPFDLDDPRQLAIATEVGAAVEWSISIYFPTPYSGRVEVLGIELVSHLVKRAHWPWRKVLVGPWNLETLQCQHQDIFSTRAADVFGWIKARLDDVTSPPAATALEKRPAD